MKLTVTLSANAGISVGLGQKQIWIDPFSAEKRPGFSVLGPFMGQKMSRHPSFLRMDACCFTHDHGDHFDQRWMQEAHYRFPDAPVFLPEEGWSREFTAELGDVSIRFVRLPHEGTQYTHVRHYGIIVSYQGKNILISGDCAVAAGELAKILENCPIHLAIVNFPWLTLSKGRDFVSKFLTDCPILLVHLPFAEDDLFDYRAAAIRECDRFSGFATPLMEPFQTIQLDI